MKQRNEQNRHKHDDAVSGMAHAIDQTANQPRKPRMRKHADNGNAAFHDPNDALSTGLQTAYEEYKKQQN